jgi:hypothetical protein
VRQLRHLSPCLQVVGDGVALSLQYHKWFRYAGSMRFSGVKLRTKRLLCEAYTSVMQHTGTHKECHHTVTPPLPAHEFPCYVFARSDMRRELYFAFQSSRPVSVRHNELRLQHRVTQSKSKHSVERAPVPNPRLSSGE